jgi:DNA-binding response OmpR family regulator
MTSFAREVLPNDRIQTPQPSVCSKKGNDMAVTLLIDDDPLQARLIIDNLSMTGHKVLWTRQCWESLLTVHSVRPDLVLVDCAVPQWVELLTLLRAIRNFSKTPVLLVCVRRPSHYYLKKLDIASCIDKPFSAEALVEQVQRITQPMLPSTETNM